MNDKTPEQTAHVSGGNPQVTAPTGQPVRLIVETAAPGKGRWGTRLLTIAFIFSLLLNFALFSAYGTYLGEFDGAQERYHSGSKTATDKLALISVEATIMPPFTERIIDHIRKATEDDDVKGAVVVVDSPGGLVADSHQIYHELKKLAEKKPVFVQMKRIAASGGYYVAMGAGKSGKIVAEPTTWTGSIGVIIPHYDLTELAGQIGVKSEPLTTGEFKDSLSSFKPLSDRERDVWKGILDDAYQRFLSVIEQGRPDMSRQQIEDVATGRIFTSQQALAEGLVDEIGFLDETIAGLAEQLNLKSYRVIEYQHPPTIADILMGSAQSRSELSLLRELLQSPSPRAFYMLGNLGNESAFLKQ
ncbi:MAG: signal peptide peptidase SppA [Rubinisphaera brasiliensis]|uniref:Signal peptide peptidase SppA, 36K type n=1 Tax=Rubinisphaera brasiliensis (strain ATCC 49424 / DSM 5305 / JCM 21570 / IAM 15109 / NBRC 103401 / IFAM 1448) TaxID=756272 RepID=F0SGD9_RUBBR|nr:signal peptide peptidase SppA [Rubinisphaera brasiliensis]ADY60538.1 signal peptide peptidase SppA, 36K type [Rubinisphaera brasiliensis DSM 5305]